MVQAGLFEAFHALVQGLDEFQAAVRAKQDLPRVGVKCQDQRLGADGLGLIDHPIQQRPVAQVDPVKGARGRYATLSCFKVG